MRGNAARDKEKKGLIRGRLLFSMSHRLKKVAVGATVGFFFNAENKLSTLCRKVYKVDTKKRNCEKKYHDCSINLKPGKLRRMR